MEKESFITYSKSDETFVAVTRISQHREGNIQGEREIYMCIYIYIYRERERDRSAEAIPISHQICHLRKFGGSPARVTNEKQKEVLTAFEA